MARQRTEKLKVALDGDRRAFNRLERAIHERVRLEIVSVLTRHSSLRFVELRDGLGLTDGNLAAHLKVLRAAGVVKIHKTGKARYSVTTVTLTPAGRAMFRRYLDALAQIVKRHR